MTNYELILKVVNDEVDVDLAEYGHLILEGGTHAAVASAVVNLFDNPDRQGVWSRFVRSMERTYGPSWFTHENILMQTTKCRRRGCMELAVGDVCDRCLVNR